MSSSSASASKNKYPSPGDATVDEWRADKRGMSYIDWKIHLAKMSPQLAEICQAYTFKTACKDVRRYKEKQKSRRAFKAGVAAAKGYKKSTYYPRKSYKRNYKKSYTRKGRY